MVDVITRKAGKGAKEDSSGNIAFAFFASLREAFFHNYDK